MAWTSSSNGTQTSVIGTEQTLTTDTTNATYYFEVDISPLQLGDVLELRMYVMTLSGGTLRLAWKESYGPLVPVNQVSASPPQPSDQSLRVTLLQVAGTPRSFSWKLIRV